MPAEPAALLRRFEGDLLIAKLYQLRGNIILAACDDELLGKELADGKYSVKIKESFFGIEKVGEKKFLEFLKEADNVNLFGEKCVELAIREGYINKDGVIRIKGVPHVQIYKIPSS